MNAQLLVEDLDTSVVTGLKSKTTLAAKKLHCLVKVSIHKPLQAVNKRSEFHALMRIYNHLCSSDDIE